MPKILIVGKNSFIGKSFQKQSKFRDFDIVSVREKPIEDIEFINYDIILYLAAIVHQNSNIPESEYFRVNRDLCSDVAKRAKEQGVKQFVFISSVKVYGNNTTKEPLNENSICSPKDSYSRSKYEAENQLQKISSERFKVSIIRIPLVYGAGVKANMLGLVKLVDWSPILPFDNILNRRTFVYIENLIEYIDRIIELSTAGMFLCTDNESISTTELVKNIADSLNKKRFLFKTPVFIIKIIQLIKPGIIERLYSSFEFNNEKTLSVLNFKPKYSIKIGIEKTVFSYKQNKL